MDQVEHGKAHLGLVGGKADRSHLEFRPFACDEMVLAVAGFYALGLHRAVAWDSLRSHLDLMQDYTRAHLLLAVVLIFLAYGAVAALSLPVASALGLLAGALFGRWLGTGLVDVAATLGATLAFLSSRYLLRDGVQLHFGRRLEALNRGVNCEGAYYLFTLRLVPIFPFFLVNLAMGLTPLRVWTFTWVSLLGMLPGTFLYVNAGAELGRMASPQDVLSPGLLASLAALGLVPVVLRWLVRRGPLSRRPCACPGPYHGAAVSGPLGSNPAR